MSITMNLKSRLIGLFLLVALLPLAVLGVLSYRQSSEIVRQEVEITGLVALELTTDKLNTYFFEKENIIETLAETRDIYQSVLLKESGGDDAYDLWLGRLPIVDNVTRNVMEKYGFSYLFITDVDGNVIYTSDDRVKVNTNLLSRDYLQGALKGETSWSFLYYSDLVKENCMTVSSPIRSDGDVGSIIGTYNLTLSGKDMDAIVNSVGVMLGETGSSYLIDSDGLLLTNTTDGDYTEDSALKERLDTDVVRILSGPIRAGDMDFRTAKEYRGYTGLPAMGVLGVIRFGSRPAGLVIALDLDEAMAEVKELRNRLIGLGLVVALIVAVVSYLIAAGISAPITNLADTAVKVAKGDLTQEIDIRRQDEIGTLGKAFNAMIRDLRELVREITSASSEVTTSSQELSASTEEIGASIEEVASSSNQFTGSIQQLASNAERMSVTSNDVLKLSEKGGHAIGEVINGMDSIESNVKVLGEAIDGLGKRSQQIGRIVETITDISDQTNLLALNAAIEAARAGEHGRGFAVVADEVRKLAEEAGSATQEIEALIASIREDTNQTVERMQVTNQEVQKGSDIMHTAGETFDSIIRAVQDVASQIQEVSAATEEMGAGSEEIASATEEQASSIEQVASMAQKLSELALNLQEQVSIFKI